MSISRDSRGFTVVDPAEDSIIIYVSTDGNDANDGTTPVTAIRTVSEGIERIRNGSADQLLLRRGDIWHESITLHKSGRDSEHPLVIGTYGDSSHRPAIKSADGNGLTLGAGLQGGEISNIAILGIRFVSHTRKPGNDFVPGHAAANNVGIECNAPGSNIIIEDCEISHYRNNIVLRSVGLNQTNVTIRRNIITDSYSTGQTTHGLIAETVDGLVIEENVFDHNGWNDEIPLALPTIYGHNIYISSGNSDVSVCGNIVSRASNFGVQLRCGGRVVDNLFIRNSINLLVLHNNPDIEPDASVVSGNVFQEAKDIDQSNPRGGGITVSSIGTSIEIVDNLFSNTDRPTGRVLNISDVSNIKVSNNIIYNWVGNIIFDGSIGGLEFSDNQIQSLNTANPLISFQHNVDLSDYDWVNNIYYSTRSGNSWFTNGSAIYSFLTWRNATGETGENRQLDYPDINRSVAGYNQSIGGDRSFYEFIAATRLQSSRHWDDDYTARSANAWLYAGFVAGAMFVDDNGFTGVSPSIDSIRIYVSNSQGSDSNDGLRPDRPLKTIEAAKDRIRIDSSDQLLLRCGDVWDEGFGVWTISGGDVNAPILISHYGDTADGRPTIRTTDTAFTVMEDSRVNNLVITGIEFYNAGRDPDSELFVVPSITPSYGIDWRGSSNNIVIEDCSFRFHATGIRIVGNGSDRTDNLKIRRNIVTDCYGWDTFFNSFGIWVSGCNDLLIEENFLDHNGWNERVSTNQILLDYFGGDTTQASRVGRRTISNHNILLTNNNTNVICRGNIATRPSNSSIEARCGGSILNNIISRSPVGLLVGGGDLHLNPADGISSNISDNVIVNGVDISASALRGDGIRISDVEAAQVDHNIVSHYIGLANQGRVAIEQNPNATYDNNIVYSWRDDENTPELFSDPSRDLASYNAHIGGQDSFEEFALAMRGRSASSWPIEYSYDSIYSYINDGFEIIIPGVKVDDNGFVSVTPGLDSKVIYVSSSTGSDDNDGTMSSPVASLNAAKDLIRDKCADQILLKRGDIWNEEFGEWHCSGKSTEEPLVIGAYGEGDRPVINCKATGIYTRIPVSHLYIIGIELHASIRDTTSPDYIEWDESVGSSYTFNGIDITGGCRDLLIEDCVIKMFSTNINISGEESRDVMIRRNSILGAWDITQLDNTLTSYGIKLTNVEKTTITQNILDHNGWNGNAPHSGRISFNHGVMVLGTDGMASDDLMFINNYVLRSSNCGVSSNVGGVFKYNVFGLNATAGSILASGLGTNVLEGNVIIDATDSDLASGRGWEYSINEQLLIKDNIFTNNADSMRGSRPFALSVGRAFGGDIENNIVYEFEGGFRFGGVSGFSSFVNIKDNSFQNHDMGRPLITHDSNINSTFNYVDNTYYSRQVGPFRVEGDNKTFTQFQHITGESGGFTSIEYYDTTRNLYKFSEFLGGDSTIASLVEYLTGRQHGIWNDYYEPLTCVDYIREGFDLGPLGSGAGQDLRPPESILLPTPLVSRLRPTHEFQIIYRDESGVDVSSIDDSSVVVVNSQGASQESRVVSIAPNDNLTTVVVTYNIQPFTGEIWNSSHNGDYKVMLRGGYIADIRGNVAGDRDLGIIRVNIPTNYPVVVLEATTVTKPGDAEYVFNAIYSTTSIIYEIDSATIENSNITVTGPNGYITTAELVSIDPQTNSTLVTAQYKITPPGGEWNQLSNGTYVVEIAAGSVIDTYGTPNQDRTLGSFDVAIEEDRPDIDVAVTATSVVGAGGSSHRFEVKYSSQRDDISRDTIRNGNIAVIGPNDYNQHARVISISEPNNSQVMTVIYEITPPGSKWDYSHNGTYEIILLADQIGTIDGTIAPQGRIGSFIVAIPQLSPLVSVQANNIVTNGKAYYEFEVTYGPRDTDSVIDTSTIDNSNITIAGPSGFSAIAELSHINTDNSNAVTATYRVNAPHDLWDERDNGIYSITLGRDSVLDNRGVPVRSGTIGHFIVNINEFDASPLALPVLNNVVYSGASARFRIDYYSKYGIDVNTINSGGIDITTPDGVQYTAGILDAPGVGSNSISVLYGVGAPSGEWSIGDNGDYVIHTRENGVSDTNGNRIGKTKIGRIVVAVRPDLGDIEDLAYCQLLLSNLYNLSQFEYYRMILCPPKDMSTDDVLDWSPHRFVELFGGDIVPTLNYTPDPENFRGEYLYNTRLNVLYKKVILDNRPDDGIIKAIWREASSFEPINRVSMSPKHTDHPIIDEKHYRRLVRCADGLISGYTVPEEDVHDGIIIIDGIGYSYDNDTIPFPVGRVLHSGEYTRASGCNSPLCNYRRLIRCADDRPTNLFVRVADIVGENIVYGGICYYLDGQLNRLPDGRILGSTEYALIDDCLDPICTYRRLRRCDNDNQVDLSVRVADIQGNALHYRGNRYYIDNEISMIPHGVVLYPADVIWLGSCT